MEETKDDEAAEEMKEEEEPAKKIKEELNVSSIRKRPSDNKRFSVEAEEFLATEEAATRQDSFGWVGETWYFKYSK